MLREGRRPVRGGSTEGSSGRPALHRPLRFGFLGRTVFFPAGRDSTPTASTTTTTGDGGALYSATAVAATLNNVDQPSRATSLSNVHSLLPTGDRDYEKTTTTATAVGGRPGLVRGGAEARTLFIYSSLFLSLLLCDSSPLHAVDPARPWKTLAPDSTTNTHRPSSPVPAHHRLPPTAIDTLLSTAPPPPPLTQRDHPRPPLPPSPSSSSLAIAARHDFTTKQTNNKNTNKLKNNN